MTDETTPAPKPPTHKETLIAKLNAMLVERGLPISNGENVNRTVEDLERCLYELENPPVAAEAKPEVPTAKLLERLNKARAQNDMPPLKMWKASRMQLAMTIARLERTSTKVEVKKIPPAIAKGSGLTKRRTDLHHNKVHDAVKKQRAEEGKEPKAKREGSKTSPVRKGGEHFGPGDIADALGIDAKKVRIFLRKRESDIPSDYRDTAAGRWAFKPAHKQWFIDWVKKGGK
jgi:phage terminase Nu1 subunit (DNA packaging protein)